MKYLFVICSISLFLTANSFAQSPEQETPPPITIEQAHVTVEEAIETIDRYYALPDKAPVIAEALRERLAAGAYDQTDVGALAATLNADLREISQDLHMSFRHDPDRYNVYKSTKEDNDHESAEKSEFFRLGAQFANYGIGQVKRLTGNIGYLEITGFHWFDDALSKEKITAAMALLHGSDAIIIDVRRNGGGHPEAVRLVQSYFFDQPTHVLTFHDRLAGTVEESMTAKPDPAKAMGALPIYVLTSRSTGSAAEDFSYIMKVHDKAILIGETTAGAGHTVDFFAIDPGFILGVATGRPESPITGTGWEGVGVSPDVETRAANAFDVAQLAAFTELKTRTEDPRRLANYNWAIAGLDAKAHPPQVSKRQLRAVAGQYGPRKITYKKGKLYYSRDNGPQVELLPLTETLFQHAEAPTFRIRFIMEGKKAVALEGLYDNGRIDRNERTD